MNFFEQELRSLLNSRTSFKDATYVGRVCIKPLSNDVRLKVEFATIDMGGHYDAIELSIINAKEGTVDRTTLYMSDYLSKASTNGDPAYAKTPYIWESGRFGTAWYPAKPSSDALKPLADAVCDYANAFK